MNLENAIRKYVEKKGLKMDFVYNSINMTASGFYKMLRNNSIKVETLEKIAKVLNVPERYFFESEEGQNRIIEGHFFPLPLNRASPHVEKPDTRTEEEKKAENEKAIQGIADFIIKAVERNAEPTPEKIYKPIDKAFFQIFNAGNYALNSNLFKLYELIQTFVLEVDKYKDEVIGYDKISIGELIADIKEILNEINSVADYLMPNPQSFVDTP